VSDVLRDERGPPRVRGSFVPGLRHLPVAGADAEEKADADRVEEEDFGVVGEVHGGSFLASRRSQDRASPLARSLRSRRAPQDRHTVTLVRSRGRRDLIAHVR
jgi:hypothetical protein